MKPAPRRARSRRAASQLLWGWMRPQLRWLVVAQVLGLLGAAAGLASPLVTKTLVEDWSTPPRWSPRSPCCSGC